MRRKIRTLFLFLLIAVILLPQAVYADGQPSSISFKNADKVSIVYEEKGFKDLEFTIYNNKTTPIDLTYRIEPPQDKEGHRLLIEDLLEEKTLRDGPSTVSLPAAGSKDFTISFKEGYEPLYEGTYTAKLIVSDLSNDQVISKELEFVFPKPAESFTPKPLKKEWTARVERWLLWNNSLLRTTQNCLPLDVDYAKLAAVQDPAKSLGLGQGAAEPLGILFGENGEMAQVYWTGEIKKLPDGKAGILLEFLDLKKIGKYSGTLTLFEDKDKKEGDVTFTLNYTTNILWPILLISAGILLAVWAGAYSNSKRKVMLLRRSLYKLPGLFEQAHKKYLENIEKENKNPAFEVYKNYTFKAAIFENIGASAKPKSLLGRVQKLQTDNPFSLADENEDYKTLLADIKKIQEHIEAWPLLGSNLAKLDGELLKFKEQLSKLDPTLYFGENPFPEQPKLLPDLESPLKEKPQLNFETLTSLTAKTEKARALIKTWQESEAQLRQDYAYLNKVEEDKVWKKYSDEDRERFGKIVENYGAAAYVLWFEEKADNLSKALDTLQIHSLLPFLKNLIIQHPLSGKPLKEKDQELWTPTRKGDLDISEYVRTILALAGEDKEEQPAYALEAEKISTRLWALDILLVFLAFVFALAAGLESEIIGKNFGTVWDVIKLLTLGLASKLTLDTLDKALGVLKPKEG